MVTRTTSVGRAGALGPRGRRDAEPDAGDGVSAASGTRATIAAAAAARRAAVLQDRCVTHSPWDAWVRRPRMWSPALRRATSSARPHGGRLFRRTVVEARQWGTATAWRLALGE